MNDKTKKEITHRIKIIDGHVKKVLAMVEAGEYCMDILHQTRAIGAALKSAEDAVLENHLRTCVRDSIKNAKSEEKIISELIESYKASHR